MSAYRTSAAPPSKQSSLRKDLKHCEQELQSLLRDKALDAETTLFVLEGCAEVSVIYPRGARGKPCIVEQAHVLFHPDDDPSAVINEICDAHMECLGRISARLGVL